MNELEEFIKIRFDTKALTLHDRGIKVFRSAQVSLTNPDLDLEFYEVSTALSPNGDNQRKKKKGANPKTLMNQVLKVGDVLISARTKLGKVTLIEDTLLNKEIPTVAMNGVIIIRTENIDLGHFIKYYLELPEVQNIVNSDARTINNGKRRISKDFILELPFPNISAHSLALLQDNMDYLSNIQSKAFHIYDEMKYFQDLQLAQAYSSKIAKKDSHNLEVWQEFEERLNNLKKQLDTISKDLQ